MCWSVRRKLRAPSAPERTHLITSHCVHLASTAAKTSVSIMSDAVSGGLPCLDTLETITIAGAHIHTKRVTGGPDAGLAPNGILLLLLHDVRNILSEPNVSEQAALSRVNKLQKRFFDFDELGISVSTCAISAIKNKHDIPENIVKQIKTSSKANGLWFVTIDAAMKIVFKFCSPQDAIRFSLDLSPFLVCTFLIFYRNLLSFSVLVSIQTRISPLFLCNLRGRSFPPSTLHVDTGNDFGQKK